MSKIRGTESKPEIVIRSFLHKQGFRFRKNDKRYPGTPDIVLPKYKTITFVHGCFWHGHKNCKASKLPETRKDFWKKKISDNIMRDRRNIQKLERQGWNVIVVWDCEINSIKKREKRFEYLLEEITSATLL